VTGDSYTHYFQLCVKKGTGIDALLAQETNLPIVNVSSAGGTTQPVKNLARNAELLDRARVVVWIVSSTIVGYNELWDLPKSLVPAKEVK
jgi:hypothetical protein